MQTCNIYKYVTVINMFILSLNRLTVCRSEGICLQPCKTVYVILDIKQNNVEAKGNVAFFYGVNKASICMTGVCTKFPFKQTFIYLFIHFHCSLVNF